MGIVKNSLSPRFPPEPRNQQKNGKSAHYSDTNYQLLGSVLETMTNKTLQEIYSELIFEPLDLRGTYLQGYGSAEVISAHPPASVYYKKNPVYIYKAMISARFDGGIVSNINDNLKFLHAFLCGEIFNDPSTLKRMMNWKMIFFPLQYGFGLMRVKILKLLSPFSKNPELIGHSGATSAFLFQSEPGKILISGTLNQVDNQARPVRLMMKLVSIINKALS
jgi:D-alanyl-D-alanine carboxypeptidase